MIYFILYSIVLISNILFVWCYHNNFQKFKKTFGMLYMILFNHFVINKIFLSLCNQDFDTLINKENINFYSFIDSKNFITILFAISAILSGILIFIAGIKRNVVKHLYFKTTKIKDLISIIIIISAYILLKVKLVFLIGPILYVMYYTAIAIKEIYEFEILKVDFEKKSFTIIKNLTKISLRENNFSGFDKIFSDKNIRFYYNENKKENYNEVKALKDGYIESFMVSKVNQLIEYLSKKQESEGIHISTEARAIPNEKKIINLSSVEETKKIILHKRIGDKISKNDILISYPNSYKKVDKILKNIVKINKNYHLSKEFESFFVDFSEELLVSIEKVDFPIFDQDIKLLRKIILEKSIKLQLFRRIDKYFAYNSIIELLDKMSDSYKFTNDKRFYQGSYYLFVLILEKSLFEDDKTYFNESIRIMYNLSTICILKTDYEYTIGLIEVYKSIMDRVSIDYKNNISFDFFEYYIFIYRSLLSSTVLFISNNKFEEYKYCVELIDYLDKYNEKIDDLKKIKEISYLGVLLYLNYSMLESKTNYYKLIFKENNFYMNYFEIIGIFFYLEKKHLDSRLEWDNWFRPSSDPINVYSFYDPTKNNIDELFIIIMLKGYSTYFKARSEKDSSYDTNYYHSNFNNKTKDFFKNRLNYIKENGGKIFEKYKDVLYFKLNDNLSKLNEFIFLFENENEREKKENIQVESIDKSEVNKIKDIIKSNLKDVEFLTFLKQEKIYEKKLEISNKELLYYSIDEIFPKEWVLQNPNINTDHIWEESAKKQKKNLEFLFMNCLEDLIIKVDKTKFDNKINNIISQGVQKEWVIIFYKNSIEEFKENFMIDSIDFEMKNYKIGSFKNFDVWRFKDYNKEGIYLLNTKKLKFIHYNPIPEKKEGFFEIIEYCSFSLYPFSDYPKIKKSIIESNPEWLRNYETEEAKIFELNQYIHFMLSQKAGLKKEDNESIEVYQMIC